MPQREKEGEGGEDSGGELKRPIVERMRVKECE